MNSASTSKMTDPCKLPPDVHRLLFAYCGDVTRATACSVSSRWHAAMLAVSMYLSDSPQLYLCDKIDNLSSLGAIAILKDYHLTVRLSTRSLFNYKRELCIANNPHVGMLFESHGHRPGIHILVLATDPYFTSTIPMDYIFPAHVICNHITFLLQYKLCDTILDNPLIKNRLYWFHDIIDLIVATGDPRMVTWFADRITDRIMLLAWEIVRTNNIDMLKVIAHNNVVRQIVCKHGSINIFDAIYTSSVLKYTPDINEMLEHAYINDSVDLVNHLQVKYGACVELNIELGCEHFAFKCLSQLNYTQQHVSTMLKTSTHIIDMKKFIKYIKVPVELINAEFATRVRGAGDKIQWSHLLPYATNYNAELYKKYGIIVLIS